MERLPPQRRRPPSRRPVGQLVNTSQHVNDGHPPALWRLCGALLPSVVTATLSFNDTASCVDLSRLILSAFSAGLLIQVGWHASRSMRATIRLNRGRVK